MRHDPGECFHRGGIFTDSRKPRVSIADRVKCKSTKGPAESLKIIVCFCSCDLGKVALPCLFPVDPFPISERVVFRQQINGPLISFGEREFAQVFVDRLAPGKWSHADRQSKKE